VTEAELRAVVLDRAAAAGIYAHAIPDSRRVLGRPGFPDVLLATPKGIRFWELKTDGGQLSRAETQWKWMLQGAGAAWALRRPADLASGQVDFELAELLTGRHP
jgi:hypothetical protein